MKAKITAHLASCTAVVGLMLIAGCAKEPKGQIVAIVNGNEISQQQMAAELEGIAVPDFINRNKLRDTVLQGIIDRELQVEAARKQDIDKSADYLRLKKKNDEELLIAMLGHRVAQTVPLPADTDIQNYMQTHPLQFVRRQQLTFNQLSFAAPKDRRRLGVLKDVHSLDAAAAALRSIGIEPVPGESTIDTGQTSPELAAQLDQAPAGEPIILPQGDRLVIGVITGREPIELSKQDSYVAAARVVRAAALLHESEAQIAAARSKAEIQYTPGWAPDDKAQGTQ